jgi:hypothetical protein
MSFYLPSFLSASLLEDQRQIKNNRSQRPSRLCGEKKLPANTFPYLRIRKLSAGGENQ